LILKCCYAVEQKVEKNMFKDKPFLGEASGSHSSKYEDDILWVVVPCSLVAVYQYFRGPCSYHHHGGQPNGGSKHHCIVCKLLPDYTVQHSRRQSSSSNFYFILQDIIPKFRI
jgi:hypothetical protein